MTYSVNEINKELKGWDNGNYFGQWETDKIIESYFDASLKGVCVEVGAANGIKGSNTLYFEQRGWNVLCIEPNPEHIDSLLKHRKNNLFFACAEKEGTFPLTVFKVGERNISSSLTSLNPDKRLVESHRDIINESYTVDVNVKTLTDVLNNHATSTQFGLQKSIDFISIDTEGTELNVLQGFNFEYYDVKLFVIENNYNDPEIEELMKSKGYIKDRRYKINDFYVKGSR